MFCRNLFNTKNNDREIINILTENLSEIKHLNSDKITKDNLYEIIAYDPDCMRFIANFITEKLICKCLQKNGLMLEKISFNSITQNMVKIATESNNCPYYMLHINLLQKKLLIIVYVHLMGTQYCFFFSTEYPSFYDLK